jgi:hypothetical protein
MSLFYLFMEINFSSIYLFMYILLKTILDFVILFLTLIILDEVNVLEKGGENRLRCLGVLI